MGRFGRKICCNYSKDSKCRMLVDGKKLCFLDETTEEQFTEKRQLQYVFCPLLPESKKAEIFASFETQGFSTIKRWKD